MEPPKQIQPTGLADYLEVLTKAVFQSGLSWHVVESKWPAFREVFRGFEPEAVLAMTPDDLDRITADTRIVRNRRKIEATVHNARAILDLDREYGGFRRFLRSEDDFLARVKSIRRRFKHVGGFGAYYFLYVVGEPVPDHEEARTLLGGSG